jgi:anhydro-N-acetylmuramic acid kinase
MQNTWEIISHLTLPFPQKINALYEKLQRPSLERLSIEDVSLLDLKITQFCLEAIKTTTTSLPTQLKKPHYIVFNKPQLWRGPSGDNSQQLFWDLSSGDAQLIASTAEVPVFTDFIRNNLIAGGTGVLPLNPGNFNIVSSSKGKIILINIGFITHITIVNTENAQICADSDVGPGTVLLNQLISNLNTSESFDRDGAMASQGKVDSHILDVLASTEWFQKSTPKIATPETFTELLEHELLCTLAPEDKVATLTALTARTVYDFCKKEILSHDKEIGIYISGGGAHNQTLIEYLTTYFDPVPIKTVEDLGIPFEMYMPLALGLTVDAFITGAPIPWQTGNSPSLSSIGRWVLP